MSTLPERSSGDRVLLDVGRHSISTDTERVEVHQRFNRLALQMEEHLKARGKVVFLMEHGTFTQAQSQRLRTVLERYPDIRPSEAFESVRTNQDLKKREAWEIDGFYQLYWDPFLRAEFDMIDDLRKRYSEQFVFLIEGRTTPEEELNHEKALMTKIDTQIPTAVRQGNITGTSLAAFKQACAELGVLREKREQAVGEQVTSLINEFNDQDPLVVAVFGSDHQLGLRKYFLEKAMTFTVQRSYTTQGNISRTWGLTVMERRLQYRPESITDVHWIQAMVGVAIAQDQNLNRGFFRDLDSDAEARIIDKVVRTTIPTLQAASNLEQDIQHYGWTNVINRILQPEAVARENELNVERAIPVFIDKDDLISNPTQLKETITDFSKRAWGWKLIRAIITLQDGTKKSVVFLGKALEDHDEILANGKRTFMKNYPTITEFTVQDACTLRVKDDPTTLQLELGGGSLSLKENLQQAQRTRGLSKDDIRRETISQIAEFFAQSPEPVTASVSEGSFGYWY